MDFLIEVPYFTPTERETAVDAVFRRIRPQFLERLEQAIKFGMLAYFS